MRRLARLCLILESALESGPCCSMFRTRSTSTVPFSGSTSTYTPDTTPLRPPVAPDLFFFSCCPVLRLVGWPCPSNPPARRRRSCRI
ncbi:hypothetical protein LX36DRAFT_11077 [Colletotrichum falcatum]|nr:hypothetical protein LX36DRAFT_11077 [Colletotrichum falcatum]